LGESEKNIEKYLIQQMTSIGGQCYKWVCPQFRGVPDRICLFPSGSTIYVEVKSEDKTAEPHQLRIHKRMEKCHAKVYVIDSKFKVDKLVSQYAAEIFYDINPSFW